MTEYIYTSILFFFISFLLSMLGLGGGQLYVPVLFWLGFGLKAEAIPLSLFLSIVTGASASYVYAKKKLVKWKAAIPFAIAMMLFAPFGAFFSGHIGEKVLLFIFATFTIISALLMLSGWKPKVHSEGSIITSSIAGTILGVLTGLLGRGGGAFIVPVLYFTGIPAKNAAATSSFIVTLACISGLTSHLLGGAIPDHTMWSLLGLSVLVGSQAGSRFMAKKLDGKAVKIIFGVVLLLSAAVLIIKDVLLAG